MNNFLLLEEFKVDQLTVRIYPDRNIMGQAVAADVYQKMNEILTAKETLRMIFAAAPSQNEFLSALRKYDISWEDIEAFHMDEYIGIDPSAPQGFGRFLRKALFDHHTFKTVDFINPLASDIQLECKRYGNLVNSAPIDICAMGIGENGHLAFNDPPVANFNDPLTLKTVELDLICRQQQVNDGCFFSLDQVPTHAYTLSIPTLMACSNLFVTVPGPTKADAAFRTLNNAINTDCPSTILRNFNTAILYLDKDSAALLSY